MTTTPTQHDTNEPPRFAVDPIGVISEIVLSVEPHLDCKRVYAAVAGVVKSRRGRRELARELQANPALLTGGRSFGLRSIELLIEALRTLGARNVATPRCPGCGKTRPLQRRSGAERICRPCFSARQQPCHGCGNRRYINQRDHLGRPYCYYCQPPQPEDPVTKICEVVSQIAPTFPREKAVALIQEAIPHTFQLARTAAALAANPALLTGQGSHGTPRIIVLIDRLIEAGAEGIIRPPCPRCGSDNLPLRFKLDGERCCKRCYKTKFTTLCVGCNQHKPVAGRDPHEGALCDNCKRRDPGHHSQCAACGQTRHLYHLGARLCRSCFPRPIATCMDCGQTKRCDGISIGLPRCDNCIVKQGRRHQNCSRCARNRRVYARGPQQEPLCITCGARKEACRNCGQTKPVGGRSADGVALCRPCYANDPISMRECSECGQIRRLYHHGLCSPCARKSLAHDMLADPDGHIRPAFEPLYRTLLDGEPRLVLDWLQRSRTKALVTALSSNNDPLSHQVLDTLADGKAVRYLRSILVASGALPPRDEYLARLERELPQRLASIAAARERSLVKSFFTWNHLRRLRRVSNRQPLTYGQLAAARIDITAVVNLLAWLQSRQLSLASCTQADIDHWLDEGLRWEQAATQTFLRWAVKHRHCRPISIPNARPPSPRHTIEEDERWRTIHRLLHDDELDLIIRVAGLLLLLFGQPLSRIVRLTASDIVEADKKVTVALGPEPLQLPPPLDALVLRLRDAPDPNHRTMGQQRHWLFIGRVRPDRHLHSQHLGHRLKQHGIYARAGRNTALIQLAAELPAAVLAKLLGLHPSTATEWNVRAGSPRAGYAAELARRAEFRKD